MYIKKVKARKRKKVKGENVARKVKGRDKNVNKKKGRTLDITKDSTYKWWKQNKKEQEGLH